MTHTLTDDDRAAIVEAGRHFHIAEFSEYGMEYAAHFYLAGLAAGRARGLEDAVKHCMELEIPAVVAEIGLKPRSIYWQACTDCAAAIRALGDE